MEEVMSEVMSVSDQGRRRTTLMEEDSKNSFLAQVASEREHIMHLKKEQGISDDICLCGKRIEPERLKLNLTTCKECAFAGKFCLVRR